MKALLSIATGGPETLRLSDMADPIAGEGQVVIRVATCGVNYPDVLIIEDRYQERPPRPFAPGGEIGGVIESIGPSVSDFAPGDRVVALTLQGGMAEKVVAPARNTVKLQPGVPFAEAAMLLATYNTSYHALKDRAQLQPQEKLLVLGAAGGVGLAAIEIGKAFGATVIAAVSSEEKARIAKAAGADATVIYPAGELNGDQQRDLTKAFRAAMGGANADVVYDPVGGTYSEAALRATNWGGRYLVVGFVAGIPRIPLNLPLLKGCAIVGVLLGAYLHRDPEGNRRNINDLFALYKAGKLKPLVSQRFPLARGAEGIALLRDRKTYGKVVVTVSDL